MHLSVGAQESLEGATEAGAEVGSFVLFLTIFTIFNRWSCGRSTGLLEAKLLAFEEELVVGARLQILVPVLF